MRDLREMEYEPISKAEDDLRIMQQQHREQEELQLAHLHFVKYRQKRSVTSLLERKRIIRIISRPSTFLLFACFHLMMQCSPSYLWHLRTSCRIAFETPAQEADCIKQIAMQWRRTMRVQEVTN